ncbi:hypothetical protein AVEN_220432-1 [Araneus ventricosus]|uniref:Uncharacterized protein n=1 Tax=Araneus ventricosus TaxID=182803 RepID=A0A4Y2IQ66_ARAVE|nr:hypothetical protein AVEN_220432-1 [Araneus ventricosus]
MDFRQKLTKVIAPKKIPGVDESNQTGDNRKENSIRDPTGSHIQPKSTKPATYAKILKMSMKRNPTLLLYPAKDSGKIESLKTHLKREKLTQSNISINDPRKINNGLAVVWEGWMTVIIWCRNLKK